jgi:hypothetical protein
MAALSDEILVSAACARCLPRASSKPPGLTSCDSRQWPTKAFIPATIIETLMHPG